MKLMILKGHENKNKVCLYLNAFIFEIQNTYCGKLVQLYVHSGCLFHFGNVLLSFLLCNAYKFFFPFLISSLHLLFLFWLLLFPSSVFLLLIYDQWTIEYICLYFYFKTQCCNFLKLILGSQFQRNLRFFFSWNLVLNNISLFEPLHLFPMRSLNKFTIQIDSFSQCNTFLIIFVLCRSP